MRPPRIASVGHVGPDTSQASGLYTETSYTYDSSDGITGLAAKSCRDTGISRPVPLLMMHGFSEDIDAIHQVSMRRFASRGFLPIAVGMRGRNGATGTNDASGREILDIADALTDARSRFSDDINESKAAIVGYSGGGANVLGCLAKLPDTFSAYVAHFGVSDYGADKTRGWYYTNVGFQGLIATAVGDTPTAAPKSYSAREHARALRHQLGLVEVNRPRLFLLHDESDNSVSVAHSDRIDDDLTAAGLGSAYQYLRSGVGDAERYHHGYPETPNNDNALQAAERHWWQTALNSSAWSVPGSGKVYVCGFIKTRLFDIWLGDTATPHVDGGREHAAEVTYSVAGDVLTLRVVPMSGACTMRVVWNGASENFSITETTTVTAGD